MIVMWWRWLITDYIALKQRRELFPNELCQSLEITTWKPLEIIWGSLFLHWQNRILLMNWWFIWLKCFSYASWMNLLNIQQEVLCRNHRMCQSLSCYFQYRLVSAGEIWSYIISFRSIYPILSVTSYIQL